MARTRGAILAATEACVADTGARAATMSAVALRARVAKATLYNHFRTKSELLEAVVLGRIETCRTAALAAPDLNEALQGTALALSRLPSIVGLAAHDPAALARMTAAGDSPLWTAARAAVTELLQRHGRAGDAPARELVLRWLTSQLLWLGSDDERGLAAAILAAGLPPRDSMDPE